ncbi:VOC family protein [Thalassobaculum sp.]|uniref:VOC family protein n=1 Tax=Thalassobaculum sp. TaxID=2022740 RepID=UPI0032EF22CA
MLSYITVGANDVPRSGRFYAAILIPLGYEKKEGAEGIEFTAPDVPGRSNGPAAVYVKKPYDGKEATVGNGSMTAFQAVTHEMVRNIHAAGLEAGGSDEGAPGFRDEYSDHFYVGYLRDPLGNKVAIFCSNPAEGTRGL